MAFQICNGPKFCNSFLDNILKLYRIDPQKGGTGIKPLDDVAEFASQVDFQAHTMVVGHLPFLERLTSFLITGQQEPVVFKLQNGGILCLDRIEHQDAPVVKWALMPTVS